MELARLVHIGPLWQLENGNSRSLKMIFKYTVRKEYPFTHASAPVAGGNGKVLFPFMPTMRVLVLTHAKLNQLWL
jgi:hypothetical protein